MMTIERDWTSATHPQPMIGLLTGKASFRKMQLFATCCCRRIWELIPDESGQRAVAVGERVADGLVTIQVAAEAARDAEEARVTSLSHRTPSASPAAHAAAYALLCTPTESWPLSWWDDVRVANTALLCANRAELARHCHAMTSSPVAAEIRNESTKQTKLLRDIFGNPFRPVAIDSAWLTWRDQTVVKLAQAAYDERELPSGHLERARLAILADALEEAGCTSDDILAHLRGPGPHVRGCWVVDLLLRKK